MMYSSWLIHTVTRKRRTGNNSDGTPSYGSADTIKVRVEKKRKFIRLPSGKELLIQYEMVFDGEVRYDDVFWFPSIAGEAADDTTNADAARAPALVFTSTNKNGTQYITTTSFP